MTDKISGVDPISGADRRAESRRQRDRRAGGRVIVSASAPHEGEAIAPHSSEADASAAGFVAQIIGQSGGRKGLRGGPPVLDAARAGYLGAAYSGPADRRPKPGRSTDTDV